MLIKQQLKEKSYREKKIEELKSTPSSELTTEQEEIINTKKPPKYLLDRQELGAIPSDFTYLDYLNLIKKYNKLYGKNFQDNLEFLRLYGPELYGMTVFQDTLDLKKSADFNKVWTKPTYLGGGNQAHARRRGR